MRQVRDRLYSFFETPVFMRQIEERASLRLLFAIEDDLLKNPERGDVIQGTRGAESQDRRSGFQKRKARQLQIHLRLLPKSSSHSPLILLAKNDTAELSAKEKGNWLKL